MCLDALRQGMLLEHCAIQSGASSESSWHQQAGTITLPKLEFFILTFTNGGDARPFLDLLSVLNLATLEVYSVANRLDCGEATFVEMSRRSGGMKQLKTLRIGSTVAELDPMLFPSLNGSGALLPMSNKTNVRSRGIYTRLRAHRIAPIHEKFPVEVMEFIFELCAPADHFLRIPLFKVPQFYTPVVTSHVCSAWRALVVTMPNLWNHIQLDLFHRSELRSVCIKAAHTLLARATRHSNGCIDLLLSLKSESLEVGNDPLSLEALKSLQELITSFSFRKLCFVVSKTEQLGHVLGRPYGTWYDVGRLPGNAHKDAYPIMFSPGMDLSNPGLLKTSRSRNALHPDAVIPWREVWHLDLPVVMLPSVILDALRQSTFLGHCVIRIGASSETSWHRQAGTITLPHLCLLRLTFTSGGDARPFLDLLSMPRLTTLEVYSIENRLNCDETTFVEMAQRSGGMRRLDTLTLGNTAAELDMMVLKRNMPRLNDFSYNQEMSPSRWHPYMP
ncbi:hypothetical protein AX17_002568 [Amanita inopinata Kibby_2008]|nr:hypothetical protein AX17_002568 [Amanita inopinata Kibby_2008]